MLLVVFFQTEELTSAADRTYIVSSHSPLQSHLIRQHSSDKPVFVEGGFKVWLRSESLTYFVLRSDCTENYSRFQETKQISTKQLGNYRFITSLFHFAVMSFFSKTGYAAGINTAALV